MECNKEEAIRARDIAEKKMQSRDFFGARKIILRAQQLFPDLENISQLLTVCEVHCSAATKVNGSEDWYGILQVEPIVDDSSIKKQYRKLALLLHPDKNKFAGAEAAFKLVGEAHRILTDQSKRSIYDMKRRATIITVTSKLSSQQPNMTSFAKKQSAVPHYTNHATTQFTGSKQQQQQQGKQWQQTQTAYSGAPAFWTSCPCGIRYQYYRTMMNRAVRCQSCLKPFVAYELDVPDAPPTANSGYSHKDFQDQGVHNAGHQASHANGTTGMWCQGNVGGRPSMPDPCLNTRFYTGIRRGPGNKAQENGEADMEAKKENEVKFEKINLEEVKKREQVLQPSTKVSRKRRRKFAVGASDTDDTDDEEITIQESTNAAMQNVGIPGNHRRRSRRLKQNVSYHEGKSDDDNDFVTDQSCKRSGEGRSSPNARQSGDPCLESDANEIRVPGNATTVSENEVEKKKGRADLDKNSPKGNEQLKKNKLNLREEREADSRVESSRDRACSRADPVAIQTNPVTLSYPDSEFHDFEKDRGSNQFAVNQIWAIYDSLDGMPRWYARIRSVSSLEFKLRFTWLEHDPGGQTEVDWSDAELPVACGRFRHGSTEYTQNLATFSHLMPWRKGPGRNSYEIYPKKGEVWALYKGWDIKWSSEPDNPREYDYEIVQIFSDFTVSTGIDVVYLVKVKGFVSLFCQEVNKRVGPVHIPANEILRFSHMVPSYRMTGKEKEGVPEGFYELDCSSLPTDLEEKFPSRSLDEIKLRVKPFFISVTEGQKANGDFDHPRASKANSAEMNQNACENQPLKSGGLSPEGLSQVCERKQNQASEGLSSSRRAAEMVDGETITDKCQVGKKGKQFGTHDTDDNSAAQNTNGFVPASPGCVIFGYPDTEFHNFESERSSGRFQPGQIWAVYCDEDAFPKYYSFIRKVDIEDFKIHVTWLEACPLLEEEVNWSEKGIPFGCGGFKLSSQKDDKVTFDTVETFSHLVRAEPTGKKNQYHIYPHVGEVWALYKKWSVEWELADIEDCEHDVVEILANAGSVIEVLVLEKVAGFKAVFMPQRNKGHPTTIEIHHNEYLRFSHRIPSFRLTEERGGKLRGYWELDPASVPEVLLCTDT